MRWFPALEVRWPISPDAADVDRVLAILDDHGPTAVEDIPFGVRVFFASGAQRDAAHDQCCESDAGITCTTADVSDEDWAERSQASLQSVTVGRIIVSPPWDIAERDDAATVVIQPSMGFGTGHHASTRLCLELLQELPIAGRSVIDVGTGSGVLAIAAARLGASTTVAIDHDRDAVAAAAENLVLNRVEPLVHLRHRDLETAPWRQFDVVVANLTGGLLVREARRLAAMLEPGGSIVASGIEPHEAEDVLAAFAAARLREIKQVARDGWVGLLLERSLTSPTAPTAS